MPKIIGEDAIDHNENLQSDRIATYYAYCDLCKLEMSHQEILDHLSINEEQLDSLINEFEDNEE